MSAQDNLSQAQFTIPHAELANLYSPIRDEHVPETADRLYETQPKYMAALARNVKRKGFDHPAEVDDRNELQEGHHRAAVAWRHGLDLPAVRTFDHSEENYRADTEDWHGKYWKLEEEPRLRTHG